MQISPGSKPGDRFSSEILSVTVSDSLHEKKFNILCKIAPCDRTLRERFLSSVKFDREALLYKKVIFEQFQMEKNLTKANQFSSYPKCYATIIDDDNEHHTKGLIYGIKRKYHQYRICTRQWGKFHGLSIAMKDQKPHELPISNR